MDPASLAAGLVAARAGQLQLALAAKMMKMNAEAARSVVKMIDAPVANLERLANVAAGVGNKLDIRI
jgi:hypothetical protein